MKFGEVPDPTKIKVSHSSLEWRHSENRLQNKATITADYSDGTLRTISVVGFHRFPAVIDGDVLYWLKTVISQIPERMDD